MAFIFIAFNAPLAVLAGYLQPAIAFGNGIGAPVAFLAAGALLLLFEVGILAISRHMKTPGAFYTLIAQGLGKPAAVAGSFLATIAYIFYAVSGYVFLGLITETLVTNVFGSSLPWQVWGLIGFAVVTVLNLLRVDLSIKAVAVFVSLEIIIVAVYEASVMIKGGPEGYSPSSFLPSEFLSANPGIAVLFALNTMIGIEAMAVFREEVKKPEKTVPRAAYGAIIFTALFFALAAFAYIVAVGPSQVVDDARNAPVDSVISSIQVYLGGFVATLVSVLLVTSQLAAANSVQGASVRYLYSMGRDRILPSGLGRVHRKLGSPWIAVLASIGICLAIYLILIGFSKDVVLIYGAFGGFGTICILLLFLGTIAAIIAFFRRRPGLESTWKSLIAPALAGIGFAAVLVLVLTNLDLVLGIPNIGPICAIGLIVITVAGIVLALWLRNHRPDVYSKIGRQES
ncbi:amino acid transporter [Subtercola lobariae]|uniref:Amino acid transporter n=1 Tax=Subtercola lobariae TaxID=1588641 RepID=A0A917BA46_9MICO|nr:amino acid transporter [Subtercola lobariae]